MLNIFIANHQLLMKSLLKNKVKFLLVGDYAVIYHGYKRTTGDMDLWLEPNNNNKIHFIKTLKEFQFDTDGIDYITKLDFEKHLAFHFWETPERVDCLTYISNVIFSEAYKQKIKAQIDGLSIPVINYNHLVLSKFSSKRLKDRADVEEIQKINATKKNDLITYDNFID